MRKGEGARECEGVQRACVYVLGTTVLVCPFAFGVVSMQAIRSRAVTPEATVDFPLVELFCFPLKLLFFAGQLKGPGV